MMMMMTTALFQWHFQDAVRALQSLHLVGDVEAFDLHHQHHHGIQYEIIIIIIIIM